ncbi:E3 ubiquitin-protein ligase ATL42-like [Diospyros lotus]|uniref:E3 ubiquitin-protein ligase ATL42-like n=1 Tax=Diospyros lotus TaxID=55363 RepID=UPI00224EB1EC|nr:E3 ubiquitin-protein ligase ATL42-like [Diospyros lotus]
MDCIDKWVESHCSCPFCRYKFEVWELTSFNYTNSLRYSRNPSNQPEDPSLELFVHREEDHQSSSRFKMANSFQSFPKPKKEDLVIQEGNQTASSRLLIPAENRSLSEITNISRFTESSTRNRIKEGNNGREEKMRRLWLNIVRQTVERFAGRERNSEDSESKRTPSNKCIVE